MALDCASFFEKTLVAPNLEDDGHLNVFGLKIRVSMLYSCLLHGFKFSRFFFIGWRYCGLFLQLVGGTCEFG